MDRAFPLIVLAVLSIAAAYMIFAFDPEVSGGGLGQKVSSPNPQ